MTGSERLKKIKKLIREGRNKISEAADLVPASDPAGRAKLGKHIDDLEDTARKFGPNQDTNPQD